MCIKKQLMNGKISDLGYELDITKKKLKEKERECEKLKCELKEMNKTILQNQQDSSFEKSNDNVNKVNGNYHKSLCDENMSLKNELEALKQKLKSQGIDLEKLNDEDDSVANFITLIIPCNESPLFKNEITDYLYNVLYSALEAERKKIPENIKDANYRKLDVLKGILDAKIFCFKKSETVKKLNDIDSVLQSKRGFASLESLGFKKPGNCGSHPKYYFCDKRYPIVLSLTPSDGNAPKQQMREIRRRCILIA